MQGDKYLNMIQNTRIDLHVDTNASPPYIHIYIYKKYIYIYMIHDMCISVYIYIYVTVHIYMQLASTPGVANC